MNKDIIDYNRIDFISPNKKLEQSFSYENIDMESNLEKSTFGNQSLLYRIYKNNDIYKIKGIQENRQIILDNIYEIKNNSHLITTDEKNIYYLDDISGEITQYLNKNRKIFKIVKVNKKIGRIKKNSILKGIHNELSEDNIIRKIKGRFQEKLRLYINNEYKIYLLNKTFQKKKINNWLKKINPKISRKIKKEENLMWFETKIFEIFSENVSSKYSEYSPDLNKKKIERLISLNEAKNVIDILFNDIETFYIKYINDEKIEGFKTLKDDIEELKTHMENENKENIKEYLTKYKYIAQNMKKIFIQKNARNINKLNKEII